MGVVMKKFFTFSTVILLFLLFAQINGQTAQGKLAGRITDAQTGEPLIGANIIIENTSLGAASDFDGYYFILNITPGTYTLKISYVGYSTKTIQNVRIVAGLTYEINEALNSGIDLDEIVVTDTKFFEEKATNTVKVIDSDQISKLPVKGVSNIAALQSGVVVSEGSGGADGNAAINVRGGRSSEVLYIIDGVPQNNVLNNQSRAQVSDIAIEQISFQVGGYEAKYGQAQSGIINVTTKSGNPKYSIFGDVISSSFTDDYGYNLYSGSLSGPILPGNGNHTFFVSAERGWFKDASPPAVPLEFPTIDKSYEYLPNNAAGVWRFSGKTNHNFGDFRVNLGANINRRNGKVYIHSYAKNNTEFFPDFNQENYSYSGKISQTLSSNSFWNLNLGFRRYYSDQYDPHFKDDLFSYGSGAALAALGVFDASGNPIDDGSRVQRDSNGVFFGFGRVNNGYFKSENDVFSADFNFTSQIENNLLEFGGGFTYNIVRNYAIGPITLGSTDATLSDSERLKQLQPTVYGYDISGQSKTGVGTGEFEPKTPILAYGYIQDKLELEDLVLNLGLRVDYFDYRQDVLRDPTFPFGGGDDPGDFDAGDFKEKDAEIKLSPRIGLGFPVTASTVFHAQYGVFIQQPSLTDLFTGPYDLISFINMSPQYVQDGTIQSEKTTQYEIGFRQVIGNNTALNITAFYKNIQGLVNRTNNFFQRSEGGQLIGYIAPANSDFGTTKGIAMSLDVTRLSYFNVSAQYTYSLAEGTGSSTSSSQTAVFRNLDASAPKVIAPLDFDQRHTAVVNIDFYVPKGELGFFEMFNANLLLSFNSGRPYTPLDYFDILSGNNGGPSTTGYVNSRYMTGTFRMDLKVEKSFHVGNLVISPYAWVENLLGSENITNIWRSTGDPLTTGFLNTELGKAIIETRGEGYRQDYISLERDPNRNLGIPRLIKLGLKVNFSNFGI
jgi:outer membrane receptor protein involved in Fe transport